MVYASRKDSNHDAPAEHADAEYGGGDDMLWDTLGFWVVRLLFDIGLPLIRSIFFRSVGKSIYTVYTTK
jgi:hypothetical protein